MVEQAPYKGSIHVQLMAGQPVHTDETGTEFRKVVVLFHSDELY